MAIGATPFQLVYGRQPPTIIGYDNVRTNNATLDQQLADRDQALDRMKEHLREAQERMKLYADRRRRDAEYEEGNWVYLRLRPYRQKSVAKQKN